MTVDRCQGNAYGDHNEGGGRVEGSSVGGGESGCDEGSLVVPRGVYGWDGGTVAG